MAVKRVEPNKPKRQHADQTHEAELCAQAQFPALVPATGERPSSTGDGGVARRKMLAHWRRSRAAVFGMLDHARHLRAGGAGSGIAAHGVEAEIVDVQHGVPVPQTELPRRLPDLHGLAMTE